MRARILLPWLALWGACVVPPLPSPNDDGGGPSIRDTDDDATPDTDDGADTPGDTDDTDASAPQDTSPVPHDDDADGLLSDQDNCPDDANANQADLDQDGDGDVCDDDDDDDSIPDAVDPWPREPAWPGVADPEGIYAHTSDALFKLNVPTQSLSRVGAFQFDRDSGVATDLAIDEYGILYVITFGDLFICRPDNARCRWLADLPAGMNNGLTFLPPGTLGAGATLIATGERTWYRLDRTGTAVTRTALGTFDSGTTTSSGDAFSVQGLGTIASVNDGGETLYDTIISVNSVNGALVNRILRLTGGACAGGSSSGYSEVWGLAGWTDGFVYAFDGGGDILRIDAATGACTRASSTPHSWYGAGVRTIIPPTP
jgi:hypothetical protein